MGNKRREDGGVRGPVREGHAHRWNVFLKLKCTGTGQVHVVGVVASKVMLKRVVVK